MKVNKNILVKTIASAFCVATLAGCSNDFLKPDPLNMFAPDETFTTESGIKSAMAIADRHMSRMWMDMGNTNTIGMLSDIMFSEMGVHAKTDDGTMRDNWAGNLTPNNWMQTGNNSGGELGWVWNDMWDHVKYANTILDYVDRLEGVSDANREMYRGQGLFHRAWAYYNLTNWFGNIPLVTSLPKAPKQNYKSVSMPEIMKMLEVDLAKAVEITPSQSELTMYGSPNKEACRQLYIKVLLANGKFKEAEDQATILIEQSGHSLMTAPFGQELKGGEDQTWHITRNVIWDLHRSENKINAANKEMLYAYPNVTDESFVKLPWARVLYPHCYGNIQTPDGMSNGLERPARNNGNYDPTEDWVRVTGRGIGVVRSTYWAQHPLWNDPNSNVEDLQDLRHNPEVGNWIRMEDMRYNKPGSAYYGKNMQLYATEDFVGSDGKVVVAKGKLLCTDTIRSWYDIPHYKTYMLDAVNEGNMGANDFQGASKGGSGNIYIYRLAETYLLRAEARLYQNRPGDAAQDVNAVRQRANAQKMYTTVNIGDIMNERARELYMEEFRKCELTRVSYILAKTGIADEWGNTYDINTWDKQEGTDLNGGSYWYQRLMHYSFYGLGNQGITIQSGGKNAITYKMDKHNLYWPIPHDAIVGNAEQDLWQNFGYEGYNPNVDMWQTWQEADEDSKKI